MLKNCRQFLINMNLAAFILSAFALDSTTLRPEKFNDSLQNSSLEQNGSYISNSSLPFVNMNGTEDMLPLSKPRDIDDSEEWKLSTRHVIDMQKSPEHEAVQTENDEARHHDERKREHATANFGPTNSSNKKSKESFVSRDELDKSEIAKNASLLSEISKDKNRPVRNKLFPPTSVAMRKTSNSKKTLSKTSSRKQSSHEGRSKNRPHRNRHGKNRYNRRRQRTRLRSRPDFRTRVRNFKNTALDKTNVSEASRRHNHNVNMSKTTDRFDGPTKGDCPNCQLSEESVRQLRLQMFIKTMADKLRVSPDKLMHKHKRRPATIFPQNILEETMQDNSMGGGSEGFYAKDQKIILSGSDLGRNCIAKRTSGCFKFDLAGKVKGGVASAQLWVYKTPDRNDTSVQTFLLYGLERLRSGRILAQNQLQRHDSNVREGWVVINVTRTVTSWVQERKASEMIAIRCSTCVTRNHKALYGAKHGYQPLIIIEYDKTTLRSRDPRSYDNCNPDYECCKRRLSVNFRKIRMTDIEAPPELSVGYCYGNCGDMHHYTYNHTMFKQKIRYVDEDTTTRLRRELRPCCVPIVLKPAPVIFRSGRSVTVTMMPNVVVDTCGCV